jgi:hypothetical protein
VPETALKLTLLVLITPFWTSSLKTIRVNALTLFPVYTATIVSKSLPALVIVVLPEDGACH